MLLEPLLFNKHIIQTKRRVKTNMKTKNNKIKLVIPLLNKDSSVCTL